MSKYCKFSETKFTIILTGDGFGLSRPATSDIRRVEITAEMGLTPALLDPFYDGHKGLLNLIYKYGQNDFQPIADKRSAMVGDIIVVQFKINDLVRTVMWTIEPVGFKLLLIQDFPIQEQAFA